MKFILVFLLIPHFMSGQSAIDYYDSGVKKSRLGDKIGALVDYNMAIKLNPYYTSAYYNRGNVKNSLEDFNGAIEDYTKAIEIDTLKIEGYFNRGIILHKIQKYNEALLDFYKVIEMDSAFHNVYYNVGLTNAKLKDISGAITAFTNEIKVNPSNSKAYSARAFARYYLGNTEAACLDIKKAVELGDKLAINEINNFCK